MDVKNGARKSLPSLLVLVSIAIIACHYLRNVALTEFHPDENIWLVESKYYKLLVIDGQPLSEFRHDPNGYEWIRSTLFDTACVVKSIFIRISEVFQRDMGKIDTPRWDFGRSFQYNLDHAGQPAAATLNFYRSISSSFAIAACVVVLCIGAETATLSGGIAAALFLAFHPLMLASGTRAMAEGILICFIVLSVYAMLLFAKYLAGQRYGSAVVSAAVTGIAAGLALGAKINGGVGLAVFAALCLVLFALRANSLSKIKEPPRPSLAKDRQLRTIVVSAVLAAAIALVVFISVDPVLRMAPLRNTLLILNHRIETARMQGPVFQSELGTVQERTAYIWKLLFSDKPVLLLLYAGGALLMLFDEVRHIARRGRASARTLILLWCCVTFAVLLATLLLSWDRYVLPLVPPLCLLAGYPFSRLSSTAARGPTI